LTGVRVLLAALAAGVVLGLVWAWLTPPVWLVVRDQGVFPEASAADRWFGADGLFLILGSLLGIGIGALSWWRARQHPVGALLGVLAGGLGAAVVAWWIGGLVGPNGADALLATAPVGARFEEMLGIRATAVLLAPAIAGVGTFVAASAAAAPRDLSPAAPPPVDERVEP
jgi:hypothetical protein